MTAYRYVNTQFFKRGVKRSDGKGKHCVLTGCGRTATVRTTRKRRGSTLVLPLDLCQPCWERTTGGRQDEA